MTESLDTEVAVEVEIEGEVVLGDIETKVLEASDEGFVSGYKIAKIASTYIGRTMNPQQVYNYIKKGLIPSDLGRVTSEDAVLWLEKYTTKHAVA